MSARLNAQRNLPPMEVRNSERRAAAFRNSEQSIEVVPAGRGALGKTEQRADAFRTEEQAAAEAQAISAAMLDEAFKLADLTNKEIAHLCGVSISLVEKWRASDSRGCPSFAQLLMLPAGFHIELHRVMNRRYGFSRAALMRLAEDLGTLALAVGR